MSEELESCPVCGALPIDQVDSGAARELVRDRYKFSRQELLDDCASREAARRIVDWADNGKLADDEWLVERNETAIIAICRALLSSPDARREALEEAAKVADEAQASAREEVASDKEEMGEDYDPYSFGAGFLSGEITASINIGTAIRALSLQVEGTKP